MFTKILQLFSSWISLRAFYFKIKWLLILSIIGCALSLSYGLIGGLYLAPPDYQQGDAFRIIYVHVPSAFLSMAIYSFMAFCSAGYLIWKIKLFDIMAQSSAGIGASFTAIALITGALWGKPMWGTWWVWDARLTSELILFFLYCGYIGLRSALPEKLREKASAVLAIVGVANIPIIHYSVEWWFTLHQGATLSKLARPSIAPEMLWPLLSMLVAFGCFYGIIVLLKTKQEILYRERNTAWAKTLWDH